MVRLLATLVALSAGLNLTNAEIRAGDSLHPRIKLETTLGDIVLELDGEKAPITTLNFVQYVEDKYYDGTVFHRVIKTFMIQGGGFTADMNKKDAGLRSPIKNESGNGITNVRGSIAMARTRALDSATSQFFINVVDNARLDGAKYCAFGNVVEGMETVDKIRDTSVGPHPKYGGGNQPTVPTTQVVVKTARLISEFDKAKVEASAKASQLAAEEAAKKAKTAADAAAQTAKVDQEKQMIEVIAKTEKETGKKPTKTNSGLVYFILKDGDGASPAATDRVTVHYTGWLLDGTKFDSSVDRGSPSTFGLNAVIKGWTEGVALMKTGAKWKFIIPSELAYGSRGRPSIPANSTLIFDVELISIEGK